MGLGNHDKRNLRMVLMDTSCVLIALCLVMCMVFTLVPANAFAASEQVIVYLPLKKLKREVEISDKIDTADTTRVLIWTGIGFVLLGAVIFLVLLKKKEDSVK